jgi:hypothetical protein
MLPASNTVVGVDFGAPRRARDQRRKIIAIAAWLRGTSVVPGMHGAERR